MNLFNFLTANIQDVMIMFVCFLLLIPKASRDAAIVLIVGKSIYYMFIVGISPLLYYSLAATLNLFMGNALRYEYKIPAICAYVLIPVNVLGFYLWVNYYPPDLYNVISVIIITIQLIAISMRLITHGSSRDNNQHPLALVHGFNSNKACGTMRKAASVEDYTKVTQQKSEWK